MIGHTLYLCLATLVVVASFGLHCLDRAHCVRRRRGDTVRTRTPQEELWRREARRRELDCGG